MARRQKIRNAAILLSFLLFPITLNYFSPYLIIDAAAQGIVAGSFLTFSALFLSSLFLGRAFCGWVCPGAGIQEACFAINDKKVRRRSDRIKWMLWVPWIGGIALAAVLAGGLRAVNPLYMTETGTSVAEPANYFVYFSIVALFVILSFAVGKRALCHCVCWMAPFMIIGTKIKNALRLPSLGLKAAPEKCKKCGACDKNCPMSLDVSKMVEANRMKNGECILCGSCIDNCPANAIKYSWKP
ncbi:MAG: 4Fe-4S binding protein [Candidatus Thermoplasmatota archaeon]|nr:4Fe-4S binding protein [Candidatus Thermoplasmatota archaeon]